MTDTLAAVVDVRLRPPRQGDADDGHGLPLDGAANIDAGPPSLPRRGAVRSGAGGRTDHGGTMTPLVDAVAVRPLSAAPAGAGAVAVRRRRHGAPARHLWGRGEPRWRRPRPSRYLSIGAQADARRLAIEVRAAGSTCSRTRGPTATAPTGVARLLPSSSAHNTWRSAASTAAGGAVSTLDWKGNGLASRRARNSVPGW